MRPLNARIGGVEHGSPLPCVVLRGRDCLFFFPPVDPGLRKLQRRFIITRRFFFFEESYRTVVQTHARNFSSVVVAGPNAVAPCCQGYKWTTRLAIGVRDVGETNGFPT
jgi:hypothetical protein